MKRYTIALLTLGFLTACAAPPASPIPTAYPPEYLPTVIALTAEAASNSATETAIALNPVLSPSDTPTPTLSPTPRATFTATTIPGHDPAAIQIFSPGPMSKVISPINLKMNIITGESGKVQIDLYGEDG